VKVLSFVNVYIDNGCLRKDKHATDDWACGGVGREVANGEGDVNDLVAVEDK
jgi:hypothetical protein